MRTTVTLPDHLLRRARFMAAQQDRTVSSVIAEALLQMLGESADGKAGAASDVTLPVISGGRWIVDINRNSAVIDALDRS